MRAPILAAAVAAMMLGGAAGCSRAPAPAAATRTIVIDKMAYGPAPPGLMVGDTLVWRNADIFRHSATARNGAFDIDLQPGASGEVTLKSPGVIDVYCRYHPDMTLRLTVNSR